MNFTIELEQESDGRWLAEVLELPGVLAYGTSSLEAVSKVEVLALRVLLNGSKTTRAAPAPSILPFRLRHEPMTIGQSKASSRGAAPTRLADQTTIRFA